MYSSAFKSFGSMPRYELQYQQCVTNRLALAVLISSSTLWCIIAWADGPIKRRVSLFSANGNVESCVFKDNVLAGQRWCLVMKGLKCDPMSYSCKVRGFDYILQVVPNTPFTILQVWIVENSQLLEWTGGYEFWWGLLGELKSQTTNPMLASIFWSFRRTS